MMKVEVCYTRDDKGVDCIKVQADQFDWLYAIRCLVIAYANTNQVSYRKIFRQLKWNIKEHGKERWKHSKTISL